MAGACRERRAPRLGGRGTERRCCGPQRARAGGTTQRLAHSPPEGHDNLCPPSAPAMSLAPQSAQPFSLDDDSDVDLPTVTARSSPMPRSSTPPVASSSQVPYRDSIDQSIPNPIFDYDPDAPEAPKYDNPASFYPPQPTKSNQSSREAQFELDGDELSQDEEPLLMEGMIATARARASGDLPIAARVRKSLDEIGERPLWLDKGAGVLAGIANMSNSILGAGIIGTQKLTASRSNHD